MPNRCTDAIACFSVSWLKEFVMYLVMLKILRQGGLLLIVKRGMRSKSLLIVYLICERWKATLWIFLKKDVRS